MDQSTLTDGHTKFRTYLAVMVSLGVVFLGAILALLIYGGLKVSSESSSLNNKVNSFSSQVKSINTNLQSINTTLSADRTQ